MVSHAAKLTEVGYGAGEDEDVLFDELADELDDDLDEAIDDVRKIVQHTNFTIHNLTLLPTDVGVGCTAPQTAEKAKKKHFSLILICTSCFHYLSINV